MLFKRQVQSTADSASKDKPGSKIRPSANQDTAGVLVRRSAGNQHKHRHALRTLHMLKLGAVLRLPGYVFTSRLFNLRSAQNATRLLSVLPAAHKEMKKHSVSASSVLDVVLQNRLYTDKIHHYLTLYTPD